MSAENNDAEVSDAPVENSVEPQNPVVQAEEPVVQEPVEQREEKRRTLSIAAVNCAANLMVNMARMSAEDHAAYIEQLMAGLLDRDHSDAEVRKFQREMRRCGHGTRALSQTDIKRIERVLPL